MKNIGGGDAAGEIVVNIDIVRIQHLGNIGHRGDGDAALVDAAVHRDVRMAVDDPGDDELSGGIDDLGILGRFDGLTDFGNLAILNKDGTVLDGAVGNRKNGSVLNQNDRGGVGWSGRDHQREVKETKEAKEVKKSQALCVDEESR